MSEPRETLWPIYFDAGGGRWVSFDEPVVVTDRSSAAVRGHLAGLTVAGPGRDFFETRNEAVQECLRRNSAPLDPPTTEAHYHACRDDLERWLGEGFRFDRREPALCAIRTATAIERTIIARLVLMGAIAPV